jgi:vitamin B12 transporter
MRYFLFILCFFPFVAFAQYDTTLPKTYSLPEVQVEGLRSKNFSTGQRIVFADSAGLSNRTSYTLAEQFAFGNSINIRNYGAGGLSTLSLQGSSDVHSAVVWNGFNVQSVMNGTSDLSLTPTFFVDELGLQSGSSTHLWGSGAVGGSVLLNNKPDFGKGWILKSNTETGSFGKFSQQAKLGFGAKNWYGSVKGFYTEAINSYQLPVDGNQSTGNRQPITVRNAAVDQKGVLGEYYYRWRNNNVAARVWLQDNFRKNPPAEINGKIKNGTNRANIEYQKNGEKWHWLVRLAWLNERILYYDPLREENTNSIANVFICESELRFSPSKVHHFNIGLNTTSQQASVETNNYGVLGNLNAIETSKYESGKPVRNMLAFFAQYKYSSLNNKLVWQASARQELIKNTLIPFVPSTGVELKPLKWILLKGNVARFFRLPTFNDLFWKPGGNPDLLPESGWNAEVSFRLLNNWRKTSSFYEIAFFNREIEYWIRWVPGTSYWSAKNVARVHTQGIENKIGTGFRSGKSTLKIVASSSYVLSSNQKTVLENDQSLGLQLIFIPMYQGNGNVNFSYKGFYTEYNHSYTGYTYIANDHSSWLMPFQLGNFVMSQSLPFKKITSSLVFRINNTWNANYRTVAAYPMPPRNYQLGFTVHFNQPIQPKSSTL